MKRRRVKITGIGFVTPAGIGKEAFTKGIKQSTSRVELINDFPSGAGAFVGAQVKGFKLEDYLSGISSRRLARHTQFALAAAKLAIADAGFSFDDVRSLGALISIGATLMDFGAINKSIDLAVNVNPLVGNPACVVDSMVSSIGATLASVIGGSARTMSLQSACCSGIDSIGCAADLIARGEADLAICGGTEAPLYFHPMLELRMLGLASGNAGNPERQCRPFDLWRTTGAIGEGAGVLVLQPEGQGKEAQAYIRGYAFTSDTAGDSSAGMLSSMRLASGNSGMAPAEIESVSAWGPGHKQLDAAEAHALGCFFGPSLAGLPVASIKGSIGNPLGAAGAIQVGCAALGLAEGFIPPTVNWEYADPECPLNLSSRVRFVRHSSAMINGHGLTGNNSCLILSK
jgi:3-oxoacyl-[acyl-carrier-protein] synthase II